MFSKLCCSGKDGGSPVKKKNKIKTLPDVEQKQIKIESIVDDTKNMISPNKEETKNTVG